jgi:hypothetical protein
MNCSEGQTLGVEMTYTWNNGKEQKLQSTTVVPYEYQSHQNLDRMTGRNGRSKVQTVLKGS